MCNKSNAQARWVERLDTSGQKGRRRPPYDARTEVDEVSRAVDYDCRRRP